MKASGTINTIGHSTYSLEDFNAKMCGVDLVVDVRSHPGSKKNPQHNKESLQSFFGPRYIHLPELGGPTTGVYSDKLNFPKHHIAKIRPEFKGVPKSELPTVWYNQGLWDYDVWMGSSVEFRDGLEKLQQYVDIYERICIFCCEVKWWSCHRSMISDAWVALGGEAFHILGKKPTSHKAVLGNRLERYTDSTKSLWR